MRLLYDGNLLTITLSVKYRGKTLEIDNAIVDTGSSHTVFSPDVLDQIGVTYENVGLLPKSHKGLLGLDILKINGFIVDMNSLELRLPESMPYK